ncbi:MAG: ribonuclease HII [Candidatus Levybacteria bacterium]|nr:ribonuclease HII [Candidatus Levybacteria bacterium]
MRLKKPSFKEEKLLWKKGIDYVIGIDEVGRGAFAGPIVAAGVIFKKGQKLKGLEYIRDSKQLTPTLRKKYTEIVKKNAFLWAIESVDIAYINKHGIGKANTAVFRKVIKNLFLQIGNNNRHFVLIDGFHKKYLPGGLKKQKGIIKGDQKSITIASASILAKVFRDSLMIKLHRDFPTYGFSKNKGYGTKHHRDAITRNGISQIHRTSFKLEKFI